MSESDRPSYMQSIPPPTDDERWSRMEARFHELADMVVGCRLETRAEAVGISLDQPRAGEPKWRGTAPNWHDDFIDHDDHVRVGGRAERELAVRAWNLVPYIGALDQDGLQLRLSYAKGLIKDLEVHFKSRVCSAEFVDTWGAFCAAAGAVELIYLSRPDEAGSQQLRAGEGSRRANSRSPQRRWFSHYCLRELQHGDRVEADAAVVRLIDGIIAGGFPAFGTFDKVWFQRIVNPVTGDLTQRFGQKFLSRKAMELLVDQPTDDLPPINLQVPHP